MSNRNLSSLRTEVRREIADTGTGFYSDAELNQWLNDGLADLAISVEPLYTTATVTTVASTGEYALPTDTISVKRALYKDTGSHWYNLIETTYEELFESDPEWESDTGAPNQWYWRQDAIGLHPLPNTANAGSAKLRIFYSYLPPSMDDDASTSGLPEWLDRGLILFAVYRARLKDRDRQLAEAAAQEYSRQVNEATFKLDRQRKGHAPRLQPDQAAYRSWYQRGLRRPIITVTTS